jgi:hypothetical protein
METNFTVSCKRVRKLLKFSFCTFLIIFTFIIPTKTTAGTFDFLQAILVQNAIGLSQILYQAWSEGGKNSARAIEFTVSKANDIALTLSYANVQDKTKKYKSSLFRLLYAEDDLASATLKKNIAKKTFKQSMNVESPEFASNKMTQEKYKSTLYLYDKALKNRKKELEAFEKAKVKYDAAIDNFVKIQQTTK